LTPEPGSETKPEVARFDLGAECGDVGGNRLGDWVAARSRHADDQSLGSLHDNFGVGEREPSTGESARLVKGDDIDVLRRLKGARRSEQDALPEPGAHRRGDDERHLMQKRGC
jgi:hypothetical protein